MRRVVVVLMAVVVAAGLVVPVAVPVPHAVVASPAVPAGAASCSDDGDGDGCWNPCTRGIVPDIPGGALGPGPCDLWTELPYGARFAVDMRPTSDGPCGGFAGVRVDVTAWRDGALVGQAGHVECPARGAEGALLTSVNVERMFREVARQVDVLDKREGRWRP